MGEYADMAIENALLFDDDNRMRFVSPKVDFSLWRCRDGRVMRLADMEDSHLTNTIAMLKRNSPSTSHKRIAHMEHVLAARQKK